MSKLIITIFLFSCISRLLAQSIPTPESNIDYIVTYGSEANSAYGDDDYAQVFFITIPQQYTGKIYLRIFSPAANSPADVKNGDFNSLFEYSIYGGNAAFDEESTLPNPSDGYKRGELLETETFDQNADTGWVAMGPFNPKDGGGFVNTANNKQRIFKVICQGIAGDDGNAYRLFVSMEREKNIPINGANSFTYEYSFRMKTGKGAQCYLYPFIDTYTKAIKQYNFDYDGDGTIRLYTVKRKGLLLSTSEDGKWATNTIPIQEEERNKTGEIAFIKKGNWYNDVTFYMLNQYDKSVPFYTIPIGDKPLKNKKISVIHK